MYGSEYKNRTRVRGFAICVHFVKAPIYMALTSPKRPCVPFCVQTSEASAPQIWIGEYIAFNVPQRWPKWNPFLKVMIFLSDFYNYLLNLNAVTVSQLVDAAI
jgi:hypothetical protein